MSCQAAYVNQSNRGGSRNSASRPSYVLSQEQCQNILEAFLHTSRIGLPFTRFITIHWKAAGVMFHDMVKATGRFIDIASKVIVRAGYKTSWVYVHENGHQEGWHCHILMHVPQPLVDHINRRQRRWVSGIAQQPYRKGAIKSRAIGHRAGVEQSNPALYNQNLANVLDYVLKQSEPDVVNALGIRHHATAGLIVGKRAGTSQNISWSARQRYRGCH